MALPCLLVGFLHLCISSIIVIPITPAWHIVFILTWILASLSVSILVIRKNSEWSFPKSVSRSFTLPILPSCSPRICACSLVCTATSFTQFHFNSLTPQTIRQCFIWFFLLTAMSSACFVLPSPCSSASRNFVCSTENLKLSI